MEILPASYYGTLDKSNPVISAFERNLNEFKSYMKKVRDSPSFDHFSYSRGSLKLFDTWNKYEPRLPSLYYEERLLHIADFLLENKFYKLALWQCFRRYLHRFTTHSLESIKDVEHFKQEFFPDGFHAAGANLKFRALQGECTCAFHLERERCKRLDHAGMQKLLSILPFLRIMMQAILPHEHLSWILYNGSLSIYNICRFLMSVGHAARALEYLLWACVCLETSVPLLAPSFLSWRTTLYCAVCECYYDGQAAVQAEVFARRTLGKISELGKLVEMSGSPSSPETQQAFKEATIKLAVMVFKRSVYETRRKPKEFFRLKQKGSLKEGNNNPWPRTVTERILMELFEGNAAQFLAVLEALWDSSRRPLETGTPDETEIHEVALELMSAGISILSGNGGSSDRVHNDSLPPTLAAITPAFTIMEMATAGENQIPVDDAVKFVKLLFRYEQWDMFCSLSDNLVTVLSLWQSHPFQKAELELTVLNAVAHLALTHRVHLSSKDVKVQVQTDRDKTTELISMTDELLNLVQTLHMCVCNAAENNQPDGDLVQDIVLFLWAKCKLVFQKAQTRHYDQVRYVDKMENRDKWVQTLFVLCEVAHVCQLADRDLLAVADMTLRLAMVLESNAYAHALPGTRQASSETNSLSTPEEEHDTTPIMNTQVKQLEMACSVLERGLTCVSRGRTVAVPSDASAICDTVYLQKSRATHMRVSGERELQSTSIPCGSSMYMDLHIELIVFHHRLSLKLLDFYPDEENGKSKKQPGMRSAQGQSSDTHSKRGEAEGVLLENIKKNKISKVLFLSQKALLFYKKDPSNGGTKKMLEEATALMEKAALEEKRLVSASAETRSEVENSNRPPPPPVLLSRSNHCLTFTPAPYCLEEKVCWYRIYGREAEGVNLKVRIGDCHLIGTGETIPSRASNGERLFCVSGLEPNQKYVFAVGAYDAQGSLVGKGIGDTTRPILASLPLPLLTAWAHLAQVAYQTCQYEVAKKACSEIWSHFTLQSVSQEPVDEDNPERLAQTRLCPETMKLSSPLLQQLFLTSIFVQTDIHIQEKALYCDSLSDGNPLIWGQESRLEECERMLLAIDLALHLSDSSTALQAVATCYSLLMPLIYYQIPSNPVIQVLLKCLMVLLEIPGVLKERRPVATAECLYHMVSCVTYYVAKGLQAFKEYNMASLVIEQGKKLLQEMSESLLQPHNKPAPVEQEGVENLQRKFNNQIKALEGIALKHKTMEIPANLDLTAGNEAAGCNGVDLTGQEDTSVLYTVIRSSPLNSAFKDVMKFKRKSCFMEFAALLLQRALQEDQLELLLKWGQEIFSWLNRRDEGLTLSNKPPRPSVKVRNKYTSSVIEYSNKNQKVSKSDKKLTVLQTKAPSGPGTQYFKKEPKAWESLLKHLGSLTRRRRRQKRLRQVCLEENPWLCHVNLMLAQAHLSLLRKRLQAQNATSIQHSKLPLHTFSLAHTGTLVKWHNIPQHVKPPELSSPVLKANSQPNVRAYLQTVAHKTKDTIHDAPNPSGEESVESEGNSEMDSHHTQLTSDSEQSEPAAAITHTQRIHTQILDTMCKASVHFRRAVVLAHRHGLWTFLHWACGVVWDQFRTIALLVECREGAESSSDLMLDQVYTVFTPLLVLASEVLMDLMEKLQQWKVYDEKGEDPEIRPLDGDMLVDLGWLKNLILHTLELLCNQANWETLVHLALLYNSYTREHYTHIITPVLVHAQRKLLERISYFGGPPAPQPHFTHTEEVTGEKITCRNYAGKQLFLHWPLSKKSSHSVTASSEASESLQLAEMKRAMCVASVPLDIDDTLRCFRESLAKRDYTLQTFQHCRKLLMLLLAGTQHTKRIPFCKESSFGSQDRVEFDMAASTAPSVGPPDLSSEDYSSFDSVYCLPLDHSHIQTVISSYSSSIKYLKANNYTSLQVQALHDLGNLHYYNGNQKAAHSHWSKALDCVLQSTKVLESWDGDTWSGSSSQQPLKHVGIRGCLEGALLSAKIAQYSLTTNINQRTQCCLLSAKLFKCLLRASLPHPETDLKYSSYSLNTELIPGMDVFSVSDLGLAGNTVASLGFLCFWLYTSGHYLRALPILALYHYISSKVCQHLHHTVSCRILKVKVLTELGLFAEAVREIQSLSFGEDVPLPHGGYTEADKTEALRRFRNYESLMDPSNIQVLEELVNGRPSEALMTLYGTKQGHRILLARVQLILAMCSTIHNLPEPLSEVMETPSTDGTPSSSPTMKSKEPKCLQLELKDTLTQSHVKALLLNKVSSQLSSQHYSCQDIHTDPEELELAVETRLLLCSISLQQGKPAYSASLAASALRLLQDSSFLQNNNPNQALGEGMKESDPCPVVWDMPASGEALERMDRSLWLRCTLALVKSLAAQIPGTAIYPGVNSSYEAARLLKQGLDQAEAWGDPDTQALLFLQSVTLNTHCGKAPEENITMLQEAVSLLSGRSALSQRSGLVLAKATLLLSELRGSGGQPLYQITQKLLQQQLTVLGEYVILKAGKGLELISTPALKNIYHPQLPLIMRTTMHLGQCLALQAMASPEEHQQADLWLSAQEVLQSALDISQALPNSDPQLEADILYLKGTVGRILLSQSEIRYQTVIETFLKSITLTQSHGHNLQLIHRCYMEMALIYLQQWQSTHTAPAKTTSTSEPIKPSAWKLVRVALWKNLSVSQTQLLLFWVCLRAATKTLEAFTNCAQLCGMTGATEGSLPLRALKALPDFAYNDLLSPCGDMEDLTWVGCSKDPDKESDLTWVHLSRYYMHLLSLRHIATQSITGHHVELLSASGNSGLTLKLAQLHTFFSGYLAGYKEQYVIPDPPAAFILEPKTTQLSHTVKRAVCQPKQPVPDLYPWASLNTQQLCIQWFQPTLASSGVPPNMTTLVFAMNKAPLSAMRPSVLALAMLEAGHRRISTVSLKALHGQLVVACAEAEVDHTVFASPVPSTTTSVSLKQENNKSPDKLSPSNKSPQEQVLLEKMRYICTEIRDLLQPDLKAKPFTEVPSEFSVQTLRDLERCFNPATGATVEDRALSDWLFSLLI